MYLFNGVPWNTTGIAGSVFFNRETIYPIFYFIMSVIVTSISREPLFPVSGSGFMVENNDSRYVGYCYFSGLTIAEKISRPPVEKRPPKQLLPGLGSFFSQ